MCYHRGTFPRPRQTQMGFCFMEFHDRKSATLHQRKIPCQVCAHPISQRHHLLPVAEFGENKVTAQLCANCHELFHLAYSSQNHSIDETAFQSGKKSFRASKAQLLFGHYVLKVGIGNEKTQKILDLVRHARDLEKQMNRMAWEQAKSESRGH